MKILLPSTSSQLLKVIPREYSTAVDVVLTNEENNTSTTFSNIAASTNDGYLDIYISFTNLENDTFYSFKVLDYTTKDIIHRGRIFVTDQDVNEFTINDGQFTERGKDNEYLTY